jgi:hypothetical protein
MVWPQTRSNARLLTRTTKRYNSLQISVIQEQAISLLLAGQRDQKVADELGIHRVTVTRWRLYDPGFQATLNHRRRLLLESTQDKFRIMQDAVVDALLDGLSMTASNRTDVAIALFNHGAVRLADLGSTGETDPEAIVDRVATEAQRRANERLNSGIDQPTNTIRKATLHNLLLKANQAPPRDPTT